MKIAIEKKTLWAVTAVTAVLVLLVLTMLRNGSSENDTSITLVNGVFTTPYIEGGVSYLIPPKEIYDVGLLASDIPALTNPAFTTVAAMDKLLADDVYGIDVVVNGTHRFYADQILNWHQVVNDVGAFSDGQTLVVVHDPLSGTSVAFSASTTFAASGKVYNDTLLMEDTSGTLWLASRGEAVVGEKVGEMLTPYPSQSMPWSVWKAFYPNGDVLSNETGFTRDYTRHPYGDYEMAHTLMFPINTSDDRLQPKTTIDGLNIGGEQLAISRGLMTAAHVVNDVVGGTAIVAMYSDDAKITTVFAAKVGDAVLTFTYNAEISRTTDNETGSVWSVDGLCISGTLRGTQLDVVNAPEMYWFAWAAAYPETRVNPNATVAAMK